ncbi:MAG: MipA/OmpV family protein [Gammaproteobacteria bacterium]|nr:MipA/OmpV family protein [Gammaproteobacteria bacterium]
MSSPVFRYCKTSCVIALFGSTLLPNQNAAAQLLPKWELGAGVTALHLQNYRGSAHDNDYLLPFPYLVYRSERINFADGNLQGFLFRSPDLKLDISLAGGLPVSSDRNNARAGMPDLAPTAEFGPSLLARLWNHPEKRDSVWLGLPLRSVFSIGDSGINHQGWVFAPYIEYKAEHYNSNEWSFTASIGPLFANSPYHDYYYSVEPQYATTTRPAYDSPGGYSGSRITLVTHHQFGSLRFSAFARFDTLQGAAFHNSPLVERDSYHIFGIALTKILLISEKRLEIP